MTEQYRDEEFLSPSRRNFDEFLSDDTNVNVVTPPKKQKKLELLSTKLSHIVNQISKNSQLSAEQRACLMEVKPPSSCHDEYVVRITAGAGTGKTTTLLKITEVAQRLGHEEVSFVTFSKGAAQDVLDRIHIRPSQTSSISSSRSIPAFKFHCSTLHSCAMRLLTEQRQEDACNYEWLDNEIDLQNAIANELNDEITEFLKRCYHNLDSMYDNDRVKAANRKRFAWKKVIFFLAKTLTQYCRSSMSLEELENKHTFNRVYYPAKRYHDGKGARDGFGFYDASWYADVLFQNWDLFEDYKSYDLEMKRAQLGNLEIPGTCILLDECQDCDGCQMSWVLHQAKLGKQVFLVGDASQTIYSFRGAKSQYMMDVIHATDVKLRKSWRFGHEIATVANLILFAKEYSPQTKGRGRKKRLWLPYRIQGDSRKSDSVVSNAIVKDWREMDVTLIAWKNASLFMEAMKLIIEFDDDHVMLSSLKERKKRDIPKIHFNGRGPESGIHKMIKLEKQLKGLHSLFMTPSGHQRKILNSKDFPEFENEEMNWDEFVAQVSERELSTYVAAIAVVNDFGENTMRAFSIFKSKVLNSGYSAEEADIVLTTVHSAKGMEWDNVQVCDDFPFQMGLKEVNGDWSFDSLDYGDHINLLYVACTRAKKLLSIPKFMKDFIQNCNKLHDMNKSGVFDKLCFGNVGEYSLSQIYGNIVRKIRDENDLEDSDYLLEELVH